MTHVPIYRVMLTTDIEDYSTRTDAEQRVLQTALTGALEQAAAAAGLDCQGWQTQLSGDGVFVLLPEGTDVASLLDQFIHELDAGLGVYNRRCREQAWTRMRLRVAVHAGPVYVDGSAGWPGHHAVVPGRLRDSAPVRTALSACPAADLAVIVSDEIFRDYVTQGPGNPRPTEFRAVVAQLKKQSYLGHLFVPGCDVHGIAALARFEPELPPAAAGQPLAPASDEFPVGAPPDRDPLPAPGGVSFGGNVTAKGNVHGIVSQQVSGGGDANFAGARIRPSRKRTGGPAGE